MNITIVGGSGFVGTRLTKRLLAAGHTVRIADKNDSKTYPELRVYADVREPKTLAETLKGSDRCRHQSGGRTPRRRDAEIAVRRRQRHRRRKCLQCVRRSRH